MGFLYFVFGVCAGLAGLRGFYKYKKITLERLGNEIIRQAESEVHTMRANEKIRLHQEEHEHSRALEKNADQKLQKIIVREEKLDRQLSLIEKKLSQIEKKERELSQTTHELTQKESALQSNYTKSFAELQKISLMSVEEAKALLFEKLTKELQQEHGHYILRHQRELEVEADKRAACLITTAINRLSLSTISEAATTVVALPNQEIKGRVIGREGRNIRILESLTGVNFLIDDTPNTVVISGFDPVRKEIAKLALKELIQDGRIHPTRIEEAVSRAQKKVDALIIERGEAACVQAGNLYFHHEIIKLLGVLSFRYSFGQNVLEHSLEVAYVMSMMAAELGLDSLLARKIGLLHDIGKGVSHLEGESHALAGQQIALKYGEDENVANGIGCHHEEIPPLTLEASLCSAADSISGGRPGARLESLEHYVKRAAKLEKIAHTFEGVEKAYALQAGKELRVLVESDQCDDHMTLQLARNIARKIEKELSYPGKIKVTVIREKKAIDYAS